MKQFQRRQSNLAQRILRQTLQSIAVKFILNLPSQQRKQKIRLAYHYKKAYFYYIDHEHKQLFPNQDPKKVQLLWFCNQLNKIVTEYIKGISSQDIAKILSQQRPTCGAMIFNQRCTKVLVTQAGGKYGFPKGCKNESETTQDCAAREVKQEVGLFIHRQINSHDKVEILGRGDVPVTFYIIRNFNQNEKIIIDKNQIDNAFWMNVSDVSKLLFKFTQKCRNGWRQYDSKLQIIPKLSMDQFLQAYRDRNKSKQKVNQKNVDANPLLNFKLDRQKLFSIFKTVSNGPDDT